MASGIRLRESLDSLDSLDSFDAGSSKLTATDGTEAPVRGTKPACAYQARTSSSPARTLSQCAADASPATTATWPLASTMTPSSPCFSSP